MVDPLSLSITVAFQGRLRATFADWRIISLHALALTSFSQPLSVPSCAVGNSRLATSSQIASWPVSFHVLEFLTTEPLGLAGISMWGNNYSVAKKAGSLVDSPRAHVARPVSMKLDPGSLLPWKLL